MLEQDGREIGEQVLLEAGPPDPRSAREQNNADGAGADDTVRLRAPLRRDPLFPHRPDPTYAPAPTFRSRKAIGRGRVGLVGIRSRSR